MIEVELPDGTILEIDAKSEEEAAKIAQKYMKDQGGEKSSPEKEKKGFKEGFVDGMLSGAKRQGSLGLEALSGAAKGTAGMFEELTGIGGISSGRAARMAKMGIDKQLTAKDFLPEKGKFAGDSLATDMAYMAGEYGGPAGVLGRVVGPAAAAVEAITGAIAGTGAAVAGEAGEKLFGEKGRAAFEFAGGILAPLVFPGTGKIIGTSEGTVRKGFTEAQEKIIATGKANKIKVFATDIENPETFVGRSVQKIGEMMGSAGSGGAKASQQKARIGVIENIAEEFGADLTSKHAEDVVKNIGKNVMKTKLKGVEIRNQAIEELTTHGAVPTPKANKAINDVLAEEVKKKAAADSRAVKKFENYKESFEGADFDVLNLIRKDIIAEKLAAAAGDAKALAQKSTGVLGKVKSALDEDMSDFAKAKNRDSAAKWITGNRILAEGYDKARQRTMRTTLAKADSTPEDIMKLMNNNKLSDQKRLYSLLDDNGKKSAQDAFITKMLEDSGFFTDKGPNPNSFATQMGKPKNQRFMSVFFKGEKKKELDGITKLLNATRRGQDASVLTNTGQITAPLTAIAGLGATTSAITAAKTAIPLMTITKLYESTGFRRMLYKLGKAPPGSRAEGDLIKKIQQASLPTALNSLTSQEQE